MLDLRAQTIEGEELRHLAALRLSFGHTQHVPRVPWLDHGGCRHPMLPWHGRASPSQSALDSNHEGRIDRRQQMSTTGCHSISRIYITYTRPWPLFILYLTLILIYFFFKSLYRTLSSSSHWRIVLKCVWTIHDSPQDDRQPPSRPIIESIFCAHVLFRIDF